MPIEKVDGIAGRFADPKPKDSSKIRMVKEGETSAPQNDDELDEFIVELRIPKPEVMIFTGRPRTHYPTLFTEPSFIHKITEDAKKLK